MRSTRFAPSLLTATLPLIILQVASCGSGDDNGSPTSSDASMDSTATDGAPNDATNGDSKAADGTVDGLAQDGPFEEGTSSAGDGGDAAEDAGDGALKGGDGAADASDGAADASDAAARDAAPEADAAIVDAEADTGEDADAGFVCSMSVPTVAPQFQSAAATVVCQHIQNCCGLTNAQFNLNLCLASEGSGSGWMDIGSTVNYQNSGRIEYNPTAACECLQGSSTFSCGEIDQSTWDSLHQTCLAAVGGTGIPSDGGCQSSYECAPGYYCPGTDGGACTPLVQNGGACAQDYMCSYIAAGSPTLYCNATSHTCEPTLGAATACTVNTQCASNICAYGTSTCASGIVIASPTVCSIFTNPVDAGGD
ncbi:MAG: hypothetical protein ABSC94_19735 [Polyangiaceae bacterium]